MIESELHPVGAIAFAQARGQKNLELVQAAPVDNNIEVKQEEKEKNGKQETTS